MIVKGYHKFLNDNKISRELFIRLPVVLYIKCNSYLSRTRHKETERISFKC